LRLNDGVSFVCIRRSVGVHDSNVVAKILLDFVNVSLCNRFGFVDRKIGKKVVMIYPKVAIIDVEIVIFNDVLVVEFALVEHW
jgi:hypothetical protein